MTQYLEHESTTLELKELLPKNVQIIKGVLPIKQIYDLANYNWHRSIEADQF